MSAALTVLFQDIQDEETGLETVGENGWAWRWGGTCTLLRQGLECPPGQVPRTTPLGADDAVQYVQYRSNVVGFEPTTTPSQADLWLQDPDSGQAPKLARG